MFVHLCNTVSAGTAGIAPCKSNFWWVGWWASSVGYKAEATTLVGLTHVLVVLQLSCICQELPLCKARPATSYLHIAQLCVP